MKFKHFKQYIGDNSISVWKIGQSNNKKSNLDGQKNVLLWNSGCDRNIFLLAMKIANHIHNTMLYKKISNWKYNAKSIKKANLTKSNALSK
jgi:hypothetical protein